MRSAGLRRVWSGGGEREMSARGIVGRWRPLQTLTGKEIEIDIEPTDKVSAQFGPVWTSWGRGEARGVSQ